MRMFSGEETRQTATSDQRNTRTAAAIR